MRKLGAKLVLHRETIRNLQPGSLSYALGGTFDSWPQPMATGCNCDTDGAAQCYPETAGFATCHTCSACSPCW